MTPSKFLKDIVSIYSPTNNTTKLVNYLIKNCMLLGFECYKDKAGNFVAEIGSGKKAIMLVGHIDTVPGEIEVRENDGKLFGRGSVDAKGPFASFVFAALQAKLEDKKVIVVGCIDEEGPSEGAKFLLNEYKPDFIVIGEPSGYNAITLGYKGSIRIHYINEKNNFHSSQQELNAAEEAIQFYNLINEYCNTLNENMKIFDQLNPSIEHIEYNNDGLKQRCNLRIRFRVPVNFNDGELKNIIDQNRKNATVQFIAEEKPIKAEKNTALVRAFLQSMRKNNIEPTFKVKTGTSDMNILGNHFTCPIVAYGPGDSSLDHTPDEHIDLDEFERSIRILKETLELLH